MHRPGRPPDPLCITLRKFVRKTFVTKRFRQHLREQMLKDNRVLMECFKIAVGRIDQEPAEIIPSEYHLVESLRQLDPKALRHYAETGELPAAAWAKDAIAPGNGHEPGQDLANAQKPTKTVSVDGS